MLIDTHCHLNMMVKKEFDTIMNDQQLELVTTIIDDALRNNVNYIINVGTSIPESINCIKLAERFENVYAAIGIHPNDCTANWQEDGQELKKLLKKHQKIVAIGECGLDRHYPDYNINRQKDAFRMQIELALQHQLPIIVHTRDAADETLSVLDEYRKESLNGIIHCFSENRSFADEVLQRNFLLGIGGPLTYPKNDELRAVFLRIPLTKIVLETDAPFLPPQSLRGKQNNPKNIVLIAQFLAELRNQSLEEIADQTTKNALALFKLKES